jgi:uncharacterized protein (TIGR02270 family)
MTAAIILTVVQQHADDAVALAEHRPALSRSPYATLPRLRAADDRLAAHLRGLELAGTSSVGIADALLERPSVGVMFISAIGALVRRDDVRLNGLISVAQAMPEVQEGLLCALGWVEPEKLQGTIATFLAHADASKRTMGLAACAMHRVHPGRVSGRLQQDADPLVRARACRTGGELGAVDMFTSSAMTRADEHPDVQFWAAWSEVLLGNRASSLDVMVRRGFEPGPHRERAFRIALQAMSTKAAHVALQRLATDKAALRWVIQGSGIAGDPTYVPWLIKQMHDPKLARISAEAFTLISGLDLSAEALDRPAPAGFEAGPTDDPGDPAVDTDPDDGLPWPDEQRILSWWDTHGKRFQPGVRYFMGAPVTREQCMNILRNGYQRQRILAAHYLCLLEPGTPLFNTSAPAWRQQRLLARMS